MENEILVEALEDYAQELIEASPIVRDKQGPVKIRKFEEIYKEHIKTHGIKKHSGLPTEGEYFNRIQILNKIVDSVNEEMFSYNPDEQKTRNLVKKAVSIAHPEGLEFLMACYDGKMPS